MKLKQKRMSKMDAQDDDESATFGKHFKPKAAFHNLHKVLDTKYNKCQVSRDCEEPSIGSCIEKPYRGCTLHFCKAHSG